MSSSLRLAGTVMDEAGESAEGVENHYNPTNM
jgi:hypothetical protein